MDNHDQLITIAKRLAALPGDKKQLLRKALQDKGVNSWELPIVPCTDGQAPLSSAQRRLWFIEALEGGSDKYNMHTVLDLKGNLNVVALQHAFNKVVDRHQILRTTYHQGDDGAYQTVESQYEVKVELMAEKEQLSIDACIAELALAPFSLSDNLPLSLHLFKQAADHYVLLIVVHHIAFDDLSVTILIDEINQLYRAELSTDSVQLAPLSIQYADYASWQQEWEQGEEYLQSAEYWRTALSVNPEPLALPLDRQRLAMSERDALLGIEYLDIKRETYQQLQAFAQKQNCSLYSLLLALFGVLLQRHSDQGQVNIGTSVSQRQRPELEPLIGFFVNTLVMQLNPREAESFTHYLARVDERVKGGLANQAFPFDRLMELLEVERSVNYSPLFQAFFVLLGKEEVSSLELPGINIQPRAQRVEAARFDILMKAYEDKEQQNLRVSFQYALDLYDEERVLGMLADYRRFIDAVLAKPDVRLDRLVLTGANFVPLSTQELVVDTALEAFEQIAVTSPDRVALVSSQGSLTYGQLNALAASWQEHFAHHAQPDLPVALLLPRCENLLIAMLASWKVGQPYLALDTKLPSARLSQLLLDSQCRLVVGQGDRPDWLSSNFTWLDTDILSREVVPALTVHRTANIHPQSLAYVIFTSGSTGTPKAVGVSQTALAQYVAAVSPTLNLPEDAELLTLATVAADLGHTSVFGALLTGRRLRLIADELAKDPQALAEALAERPVDCLKIVPSHLNALLSAQNPERLLPRSCLVLGGEGLNPQLVNRIQALAPTCRIINHYGPTEATVGCLAGIVNGQIAGLSGYLPLGNPLLGYQVLVLDKGLRPIPEGNEGELYISGPSLARGYLGKPDLTAERFIPNPFSSGKLMYRTGDKVRLHSEGVVEFIGRIDQQVKIRGFRVELGEIEAWLKRQPTIKDAVVITTRGPGQNKQLLAYVVADGQDLNQVSLSQLMATELPDYMVLGQFIVLEELPLLANGKVNRKGLPKPIVGQNGATNWVGASADSEVSRQLSAIWCEVLGKESVLPNDNFFELGGDSILSLQVIAKARQRGLKLTPKQLFDSPTISELASQFAPDVSVDSELITRLSAIWCEVLGKEGIAANDNFFELGGDSILSLQVIAKARQQGLNLTPKQLFEQPTIAELVDCLAPVVSGGLAIDKNHNAKISGEVALLPIQHWFFDQQQTHPDYWNMSLFVGVSRQFDPARLQQVVAAIVEHHDMLRARYSLTESGWQQSVADQSLNNFEYHDLSHLAEGYSERIEQIAHAAQKSLSLEAGQVFKVVYIDLGLEQDGRLLLIAHHLVVDGVSWRILLEDFQTAYQQLEAEEQVNLPAKSSSYKDWARLQMDRALAEQNAVLSDGALPDSASAQAKAYWLGFDNPQEVKLPKTTSDDTVNTLANTDAVLVQLSQQQTEFLLTSVPSAYRTQINGVLLTALAQTLTSWLKQEAVVIELEGHGREALDDSLDLSRTVGWFTSRFPVRLQVESELTNCIKSIKEQLHAVPSKGLDFGVLKYLAEELESTVQPQITFNYLGQLDQTFNQVSWLKVAPEKGIQERHPQTLRTHWLDVNGSISGGQLGFEWTYCTKAHNKSEITALAQGMMSRLNAIIEHCLQPENQGVTPSDFPLTTLSQCQLDGVTNTYGLARVEDIYPLVPMQQGMLFHTLKADQEGVYFNQMALSLTGEFDVEKFKFVWTKTVADNAILRTGFLWEGLDEPQQWVAATADLPIIELDWTGQTNETQAEGLSGFLKKDMAQGFDLSNPPLMRLALIQRNSRQWYLVWSRHHLIVDGWSSALLIQQVMAEYAGLDNDAEMFKGAVMAPSYRSYIEWLGNQSPGDAQVYWTDTLAGITAATPLPLIQTNLAQTKTPNDTAGIITHKLELSTEQTHELVSLAKSAKTTLNTVLQGAWALLLGQYSDSNDVVFGITSSGRPAELVGIENTLGVFINSLPLRVQWQPATTVFDYLLALQSNNAAMREYEYSSLTDIQRWSDWTSGDEIFSSLLVFENYPEQSGKRQGLSFETEVLTHSERTNFGITLDVQPGEQLAVSFDFDNSLYDNELSSRLVGSFEQVLLSFIGSSEANIAGLTINTPNEISQLESFETTEILTDLQDSWLDHFKAQVISHPQKWVAIAGDDRLSYTELDSLSDKVAAGLQQLGVGDDQVVALLDRRGLDLLVAMVGVIKSGAAWLPLDPGQPIARWQQILTGSDVALVVAGKTFLAQAKEALSTCDDESENTNVVSYNDLASSELTAPIISSDLPQQLAYVLFTSGSTGTPKGVMVSREGMLNNMLAKVEPLGLSESDVIAQTASQCFDISVWQMLTAPILGASVQVIADDVIREPSALLHTIQDTHISILEVVPSLMQAILDESRGDEPSLRTELQALRWVLPTGEALRPNTARAWFDHYPNIPLMNAYGPAECADDVAFAPLTEAPCESVTNMPIGYPTANAVLHVVDSALNRVPVGVVGELAVAGIGVGRGYRQDPQRTAGVFVPNPFGSNSLETAGSRLYLTGDLVKRLSDGSLEYLGRKDFQVKIRGYRIELGEIEAVLEQQLGVKQAVVVASDNNGQTRLVGYVVGQDKKNLVTNDLTKALKAQLPGYMVPALLMQLDALPLGRNGKVDRKALPEPDFSGRNEEYVAPQGLLENLLAEIWLQLLPVERVGRFDNFFALGGHSLLATRLVSQIRRELDRELPLKAVFEVPTLSEMTNVLIALDADAYFTSVDLESETEGFAI
ncbi:MAG: amino acid adenylation domain-containing protein [Cycloclasticus sp.]